MRKIVLFIIFFLSCAAGKVSQKKDVPYDLAYKNKNSEGSEVLSKPNEESNTNKYQGNKLNNANSMEFLQEEKANTNSQDDDRRKNNKSEEKVNDIDNIEFDNYKAKDLDGYEEVGYASFYGKRFHGMKTASGEVFDMYKLTAAHRTLPFGTIVEVENIENHKKIRVKINDRGPYAKNRIIDLSYIAAKRLGFINKGTSLVKIRVIGMGKIEPLEPASHDTNAYLHNEQEDREREINREEDREFNRRKNINNKNRAIKRKGFEYRGKFIVQLGVFSIERNAYGLKKQIEQDFDNISVKVRRDGLLYRVYIDGFNMKEDAREIADILKSGGYEAFVKEIM